MKSVLETWRPVPGYEGLYDVSDLGAVRSHYGGAVLADCETDFPLRIEVARFLYVAAPQNWQQETLSAVCGGDERGEKMAENGGERNSKTEWLFSFPAETPHCQGVIAKGNVRDTKKRSINRRETTQKIISQPNCKPSVRS